MRPTPGGGLPTGVRIWAAAALCVLPLGTTWSIQAGMFLPTPPLPGSCDPDGFCTPDIPTAGVLVPGSNELVSQSPLRVMLIFAAAALLYVATRVRTDRTRTVARLACGSLALAAALAAAHAATTALLCAISALALVAPPAWRSRRTGGGLAPDGRSA